jgi:internalin A
MPANPHRDKVFISYSHHDTKWLERLRVRLKPLQRIHRVEIWDDTKLKPGSKWREEIANAIKSTAVAIPLISAEFLASDFI